MPSWWAKSSTRDANKKSEKGSFISTIQKKFRIVSEGKCKNGSGSSGKQHCDAKHASRSPILPSTQVSRCGSFAERPQALPLPLPGLQQTTKHHADSGNKEAAKAEASKRSQPGMFLPLPKPPNGPDPVDAEAVVGNASVSSNKSMNIHTPADSRLPSPQASGYKKKAATKSPSSVIKKNQSPNSGQNLVGGDISRQLIWENTRSSHNCSPIRSPRMTSPGPSSRMHSGAVTPLHPRSGTGTELPAEWPDGEHPRHRLPLPPINISNTHPSYSTETTPVPRSPSRAENPSSHGSRWKKGKLIGRGTYGQVYIGFDSEKGEMCAMKEVTLFSDDAKSQESAKQLKQEVALLSNFRHPNIVQYFGSEIVDDKLYIYLEYVSGGSIYKLLQEYGKLGEAAVRRYTQQILSGLAYLHARQTIHRDVKGANLLVDPDGHVKLADFGMAKHISGQSGPLSFKGSPYWMAPEIIVKNTDGGDLAVDIWSLGCTVLEMTTTRPPWSQLEGAAAIFKIGHTKELPELPQHLSDAGKDFIMQCLQRNPVERPSAAQLLEHPFVKNAAPPERPMPYLGPAEIMSSVEDYGNAYLDTTGGPKLFASSSDLYVPRNVPSPFLQNTSSLLHARSPRSMSPWLCASPISSPHDLSGSSTPLTGGGGPRRMSLRPSVSPLSSPHDISGSSTPLTGGRGPRRLSQRPHAFPVSSPHDILGSSAPLVGGGGPRRVSPRLYAPPISSPHDISGSSTPLTGGGGPWGVSPRPYAPPISSPHDISGSSTPLTGGGGPWGVSPRPFASPILSPHDISGSSTPLRGGVIPIHISRIPPIYSREGIEINPRSPEILNSQNAMYY